MPANKTCVAIIDELQGVLRKAFWGLAGLPPYIPLINQNLGRVVALSEHLAKQTAKLRIPSPITIEDLPMDKWPAEIQRCDAAHA
jgi:hypothetical protein